MFNNWASKSLEKTTSAFFMRSKGLLQWIKQKFETFGRIRYTPCDHRNPCYQFPQYCQQNPASNSLFVTDIKQDHKCKLLTRVVQASLVSRHPCYLSFLMFLCNNWRLTKVEIIINSIQTEMKLPWYPQGTIRNLDLVSPSTNQDRCL